MMTDEKKLPVRNLERIAEKTFVSYSDACAAKTLHTKIEGKPLVAKIKIFARNNGTFDVVWYSKIDAKVDKVEETKPAEPKVHGLTAKQRRAKEKK